MGKQETSAQICEDWTTCSKLGRAGVVKFNKRGTEMVKSTSEEVEAKVY